MSFRIKMKRTAVSILPILLFLILVAGWTGCGKPKPEGLPDLQPCQVKVTMDGMPLDGAVVSLLSQNGQWPGNGRTDAQGLAVIFTRGQYPGVAEGEYKITVSKIVPPPPVGDEGTSKETVPKPLVKEIFSQPEATPLSCTIKRGTNTVEVKVEKP